GGLAGAFGGMGGSSAFGTKAGDVFTKVTMYVAGIWIALSMLLVLIINQGRTSDWGESPSAAQKAPVTSGGGAKGRTTSTTGARTPDMEPAPEPGGAP